MKAILIQSLLLLTISTNAFAQQVVKSFSNGKTVTCTAYHSIGDDESGYTPKPFEVYYRIDNGQKKAHAYFKNTITIGNYGYDGSCGENTCSLELRDRRTNTVSTLNAGYSKLNSNQVQIQIMNFKEDITATIICQLHAAKAKE